MTDVDLIRDLRPEAPLPGPDDLAEARGRLTAAIAAEARGRRKRRLRPARRIVLAGVAAAIATGVVIAGQAWPAGQAPPAQAAVLSFARHGGYIDVIVRNPGADPQLYHDEFQAHGLNIRLNLLPVSPSLVGTVVFIDTLGPGGGSIRVITAKGRCRTGGGGDECPVGLRVPLGYRGQAAFTFGRAARPGERYESTASVDAPGEAMHGLAFRDKTVAAVLAMLRPRHVTALFQDFRTAKFLPAGKVRGTWYVYDATPWAPQQVVLRVGTSRTDPLGDVTGG
jgi:hypothetical protein